MTTDIEPKVHDWRIAPREYARHEARRGRRHAFDHLDPERTALVVIDMVAFFVAENALCLGIVPNINRIATTLRDAGGTIAWVLPRVDASPTAWASEFYGPDIAALYAASGGEGSMHDRLWGGLASRDDDLWVEKSASSAFFPGRSPLPELLAAKGIDTVLITGTVTNVCCESSARDASTLGYRVIMVADGNAGVRDEIHNATLNTIYRSFGDVRPTSEVIDLVAAADSRSRGD
ncbi:MAG TPA: isochorismatase family cysteine hydrolase [Thermomicrobiales bacterium]|nr:isochorismatase family cysteine hydrolase [Thermomicrobiales bacterium]